MNNSGTDSTATPLTIAIAATFTAQAIEPPLAFWMDELNLATRVAFAPYNQPFQELLNPSSLLSTNRHGFNVMLIRLEDWQGGEPHLSKAQGESPWSLELERKVSDFVAALTAAAHGSSAAFLVILCPVSPDVSADSEQSRVFKHVEDLLAGGVASIPGVDLVTSAQLLAAYPVHSFYDASADKLAHAPYTPLCLTALATMIARRLYRLTQTDFKAVIVDCDDTLWTGVCGEDGPFGVEINPARQAIQDYLIALHDKGVLLCLCSRNNEADVFAVFDRRADDIHLTREHVVSSRCNWSAKSENIRALASELQLAPDAFVFLDNDPVECAEVHANCPEVLTIQLPTELDRVPGFLRDLWIFDGSRKTEEAGHRTALYRQNMAREHELQHSLSLSEFLARLDLKIHITELTPRHLARASELTHRTNQFNTTTIRRSETEIQTLCQQGMEAMVVHVKDRFGDYGLVGLMLFKAVTEALKVDSFLVSCRALVRGVEHRMVAILGEIAIARGLTRVDLAYTRTGRNQPALDFLKETSDTFKGARDADSVIQIPARLAAQLRYRATQASPQNDGSTRDRLIAGSPSPATAVNARAKAGLLTSIANGLADPEQIEAQVSARRQARPDLEREYVAPRTPTEETIAVILARVLGLDRVGVEDNFFELGGHSLLAMQVLFRIQDAFHVEILPRLLFDGAFTAAGLAIKVLHLQVQAADPTRVAALLERVNRLSDEEVKAVLARDEAAPRL